MAQDHLDTVLDHFQNYLGLREMLLVHWWAGGIGPMGTVQEGIEFVEVVEVLVVEVPAGTGPQGVLVEVVPEGGVVVPADTVVAGTWWSVSHPAYWMSTGLLELLLQEFSVLVAPEDGATAPETGLGGTVAVGGQ